MQPLSKSRPPIIKATDAAVDQIKALLDQNKDAYAIRVGVRSGGCSGFSYFIEYAFGKSAFDEILTIGDCIVLIDKKAVLYLMGSQMDYVKEQFKSGFVFTNPREKAKCGCGKSFSV